MDRLRTIDIFFEECLREGAFSCVAAGFGVRGKTLHTFVQGHLHRDKAQQATLDTKFDLASLTKVFAPGMIALKALEEGKLTLGDTLSRYFDLGEDKKEITLRQILTHTAGFHPSFDLEACCAKPEDAVHEILSRPLEYAPGSRVEYSCMGFIVLGKVLEMVYGQPLHILAREKVFEPLGMLDTGYLPRETNVAATECVGPQGLALSGVVHDENARFLGGISGNAGIFSTLPDCLRFAAMLSMEGSGFLSPAAFRLAVRNHTQGMEVDRGLSFYLPRGTGSFAGDLFSLGSFGHTGFTGTSLLVDPKTGLYAVLLSNAVHPRRGQTDMLHIRSRFHNMACAALQ